MKHMILSFKMKGDVISNHFLTLLFQKDSERKRRNEVKALEKRRNGELMMIHQCLLCWKMYTGWRKEGSGF